MRWVTRLALPKKGKKNALQKHLHQATDVNASDPVLSVCYRQAPFDPICYIIDYNIN